MISQAQRNLQKNLFLGRRGSGQAGKRTKSGSVSSFNNFIVMGVDNDSNGKQLASESIVNGRMDY